MRATIKFKKEDPLTPLIHFEEFKKKKELKI